MLHLATKMNNRRVITYGKSSRKQTGELTSFGTEGSSHVEHVSKRGNCCGISQNKRGIDSTPTESFAPQDHSDYHRRSPSAFLNKPKPNSLIPTSIPKEPSEIRELDPLPQVCDAKALFEVPSSEDAKPKENGPMYRKRRKFVDKPMVKESHLVYDDDSLQRHVAAETHHDPTQNQDFRETLKLKGVTKPKPHSSDAFPRHLVPISICKPPLSKRGRILAAQTLKNVGEILINYNGHHERAIIEAESTGERGLEGGPMNLGVLAHKPWKPTALYRQSTRKHDTLEPRSGSHSSEISSSTFPTAQMTGFESSDRSRIATDVSTATTPRQVELWNMLLKDGTHQFRSGSPEEPEFSAKDRDASETDNFCWAQARASNGETSSIPRKRLRLIDHLSQSDKSQCDTNTTSAEHNVSDNDDNDYKKDFQPCLEIPFLNSSSNIDAQKTASQTHDSLHPQIAQPAPSIAGGGLKVTYARQRSFLTNDDFGQDTVFGIPVADQIYGGKPGRPGVEITVPRIETSETLDENADEVPNHQSCTMRSIHELREAGSNARSIGEMEAILDDIEEGNVLSISQKRSRLLELVVRLQEPLFCQLFIDQGLDLRLFAQLDPGKDLIVGALYASAALQLLTASISITRLSHINHSRVLNFLVGLLDHDEDLKSATKRRGNNMSKATQMEFENLWLSLLESAVWRAGRPPVLTVRVLCLQCLEYFVRHARESGCIAAIFSHQIIAKVSKILIPDLSDSIQQHCSKSLTNIHLAASVLESYTISDPDICKSKIWTGDTLESVIDLLPLLNTWSEEKVGTLRTLVLRLYLNLTNNSPALCKQFARPSVIGAILNTIVSHFQWLSEDTTYNKTELLLDNLILALGFTINLAEWCDTARQLVSSLYSGDLSFLDKLLQLFMTKQQKAGEVRGFSYPSLIIVLILLGLL